MLAVVVGAVHGFPSSVPGSPAPVTVTSGYQRTVIFVQVHTQYGQQVFIRGGISHHRRSRKTSSLTDRDTSRQRTFI